MRTTLASVLVASLIALGAGTAAAQIDVNLAFTPSTASSGQSVTFFGSVANLSANPVTAALDLTIAIGGFTIGPLHSNLSLGAGQERSVERAFTVPSFPLSGTLTLTLRGRVGSSSDTATASLTIAGNSVSAPVEEQLRTLGSEVLDAIDAARLAADPKTMSAIKNLYR